MQLRSRISPQVPARGRTSQLIVHVVAFVIRCPYRSPRLDDIVALLACSKHRLSETEAKFLRNKEPYAVGSLTRKYVPSHEMFQPRSL